VEEPGGGEAERDQDREHRRQFGGVGGPGDGERENSRGDEGRERAFGADGELP
jgi:hypothetical protein